MTEYNPHKNKDAISLIVQKDGNWVGEAMKFGKAIRVRGGTPQAVLQGVLNHDGKEPEKTVTV